MRIWPSLLAVACIAQPVLAAGSSSIPLASDSALSAAAQACVGLTVDLAADRSRLSERGWTKASASREGEPAATPGLEFYARDSVLLMFNTDPVKPGCVVITKTRLQPEDIIRRIGNALGSQPTARDPRGILWVLDPRQGIVVRLGSDGDVRLVQITSTPIEPKAD
jgi:hypothetical protein